MIAGRAAPGALVELLRDGKVHDQVVADRAGDFVLVPRPLPAGSYDLSLRARLPGGRVVTSKVSVAVAIVPSRKERPVVALTVPNQPSVVLSTPAPARPATVPLAIEAVETEAGGKLFVSGRATAGATVRLYLNDAYLAQATAAGDGRVAFAIAGGVVAGDYRVRLDQVEPGSGTVQSRAEVPFNVPAAVAAAPQAPPTSKPAPPVRPPARIASSEAPAPVPPATAKPPAPAGPPPARAAGAEPSLPASTPPAPSGPQTPHASSPPASSPPASSPPASSPPASSPPASSLPASAAPARSPPALVAAAEPRAAREPATGGRCAQGLVPEPVA